MNFQEIKFLNVAEANATGTVQCCLSPEKGHIALRDQGQTIVIDFPLLEVDITRTNAIKKLQAIASVAAAGVEYLEKLPPAMEQKSTNG
jgi:hypothetical protein